MTEMFEEVFAQVGQEFGCEGWWEVYDSDLFTIVCDRISARLGYECWLSPDFIAWQCQMGEDL